MKMIIGSKRTRVLLWIWLTIALLGMATLLGLVLSLAASLLLGWENAPVDPLMIAMIYAAIGVVVARLALTWSMRRDGI